MLLPTTILSAAILLSNLLLARSSDAWTQEDVLALHGKFLSEQELQFLKRRLQMMHQNGAYSDTIDELFNNRNEINRTVQFTENGLVATTTSTSAYVASLIQTHVADMQNLQFPIRQGDPLFVSLFDNIEQTQLEVQNITNGVNVSNIGLTDCGVILVQEHAAQVSSFVDTGVRRPNFDWTEPGVCNDPQPLESSPMTMTTSPTLSSETMPPTRLARTTRPPVVSPTTVPPEGTTENSTISSTCAKKSIAIVCLLNFFILFLY
jgi:hypothetical protein